MDVKPCPRCGNVPDIVRDNGLYSLAGSDNCLFCGPMSSIVRASECLLVEDWNDAVIRYPRVRWLFDMRATASKRVEQWK